MTRILNLSSSLYDSLGFQFGYNLAYHLLSLEESFDPRLVGFENLTYNDWDQIKRVLMTFQYNIINRWTADASNTRVMRHFFRTFDRHIECTLSHGFDSKECKEDLSQYEYYMQHDTNLIAFMKWFEIDQHYDLMRFGSTFIFELHFDEESESAGLC